MTTITQQTKYEEIAELEEEDHKPGAEAEPAIAEIETDFKAAEVEAEFDDCEQDEDQVDSIGLEDEAMLAAEGEVGALNNEIRAKKLVWTMVRDSGRPCLFSIEFRNGLPHCSEDQIQHRQAALEPHYQLENPAILSKKRTLLITISIGGDFALLTFLRICGEDFIAPTQIPALYQRKWCTCLDSEEIWRPDIPTPL